MDELEALSAEQRPEYRPIPIFVALTGLRPSEWIALERRDVDDDLLTIRRTFVDGEHRPHGKQKGSRRTLPIPARALKLSPVSALESTRRSCSRTIVAAATSISPSGGATTGTRR